jgi:hypothetical protein
MRRRSQLRSQASVRYLDFLRGVHEALQPPTYLEIGVRHGDSLALSRSRSVGIDPSYGLRAELEAPVALFRTTSDEYFARDEPTAPLGGAPAALSFIDGMHLFEFVLRDFINVERHSDWWSVVVFDDVLPRRVEMAARERETRAWTGDVYKIRAVLERERPDLICLTVDTRPTGLLLVLGADRTSHRLAERHDALVSEWVVPDPQPVPDAVLERRGALAPRDVLSSRVWDVLRHGRDTGIARPAGLRALRGALEGLVELPEPPGRLRTAAQGLLRQR